MSRKEYKAINNLMVPLGSWNVGKNPSLLPPTDNNSKNSFYQRKKDMTQRKGLYSPSLFIIDDKYTTSLVKCKRQCQNADSNDEELRNFIEQLDNSLEKQKLVSPGITSISLLTYEDGWSCAHYTLLNGATKTASYLIERMTLSQYANCSNRSSLKVKQEQVDFPVSQSFSSMSPIQWNLHRKQRESLVSIKNYASPLQTPNDFQKHMGTSPRVKLKRGSLMPMVHSGEISEVDSSFTFPSGTTLLHLCAWLDQHEIAGQIIGKGEDINLLTIPDEKGNNVIHIAAVCLSIKFLNKCQEMANNEHLTKAVNSVNRDEKTPLMLICSRPYEAPDSNLLKEYNERLSQFVRNLLSINGIDITIHYEKEGSVQTAIHLAETNNLKEILKKLLIHWITYHHSDEENDKSFYNDKNRRLTTTSNNNERTISASLRVLALEYLDKKQCQAFGLVCRSNRTKDYRKFSTRNPNQLVRINYMEACKMIEKNIKSKDWQRISEMQSELCSNVQMLENLASHFLNNDRLNADDKIDYVTNVYVEKGQLMKVDHFGWSFLHYSLDSCHLKLFERVIQILLQEESYRTILFELLQLETTQMFSSYPGGTTLLHIAACKDFSKIIRLIDDALKKIGNESLLINKTDQELQTPLHVAAQNGLSSCCVQLLLMGADARLVNKDNSNALQLLIRSQYFTCPISLNTIEIFLYSSDKCFIDYIIDEKKKEFCSLRNRTGSNCFVNVNNLHAINIINNIDNCGWSAIHYAVAYRQIELAEYFSMQIRDDCLLTINSDAIILKNRDNTEYRAETTLLHLCVYEETHRLLSYLLERFQNIIDPNASDIDGITPLHIACAMNDIQSVETLLKHDADPTLCNNVGQLPYNFASDNIFHSTDLLHDHTDILDLLIRYGHNPNSSTSTGWTAAHYCLANQQLESAKNLILNMSELDKVNNTSITIGDLTYQTGTTLLMLSAYHGYYDICSSLIQRKVNLDNYDGNRNTAIHLAVVHQQLDIIKLLLNACANPFISNSDNYTCIHSAIIHEYEEAIHLLVRSSEDIDQIEQTSSTNSMSLLCLAVERNNHRIFSHILKNNGWLHRDCISSIIATENLKVLSIIFDKLDRIDATRIDAKFQDDLVGAIFREFAQKNCSSHMMLSQILNAYENLTKDLKNSTLFEKVNEYEASQINLNQFDQDCSVIARNVEPYIRPMPTDIIFIITQFNAVDSLKLLLDETYFNDKLWYIWINTRHHLTKYYNVLECALLLNHYEIIIAICEKFQPRHRSRGVGSRRQMEKQELGKSRRPNAPSGYTPKLGMQDDNFLNIFKFNSCGNVREVLCDSISVKNTVAFNMLNLFLRVDLLGHRAYAFLRRLEPSCDDLSHFILEFDKTKFRQHNEMLHKRKLERQTLYKQICSGCDFLRLKFHRCCCKQIKIDTDGIKNNENIYENKRESQLLSYEGNLLKQHPTVIQRTSDISRDDSQRQSVHLWRDHQVSSYMPITPLESIFYNSRLDLITHPVISCLVDQKWTMLASNNFHIWLFIEMLLLCLWTTNVLWIPYNEKREYGFNRLTFFRSLLWLTIFLLMFFNIYHQVNEVITLKRRHMAFKKKIYERQELYGVRRSRHKEHDPINDERSLPWMRYLLYVEKPSLLFFKIDTIIDIIAFLLIFIYITAHIIDIIVGKDEQAKIVERIGMFTIAIIWLRFIIILRFIQISFYGYTLAVGELVIMLRLMVHDICRFLFLFALVYIPFTGCFWCVFGGEKLNHSTECFDVCVNYVHHNKILNVSSSPDCNIDELKSTNYADCVVKTKNMNSFFEAMGTVARLIVVDEYDIDAMMKIDKFITITMLSTFFFICSILALNIFIGLISNILSTDAFKLIRARFLMERLNILLNAEWKLRSSRLLDLVKKFNDKSAYVIDLDTDDAEVQEFIAHATKREKYLNDLEKEEKKMKRNNQQNQFQQHSIATSQSNMNNMKINEDLYQKINQLTTKIDYLTSHANFQSSSNRFQRVSRTLIKTGKKFDSAKKIGDDPTTPNRSVSM
ncbi:hypothetical protein SNEBB_002105 [Seison nebaliae]|nr:hypothetical protein SNEBB_002105 [Seison nebaliae]